jgi:hypothetical protein
VIRRTLFLLAAAGVAACLPADSRPPPAQVFISGEASGFTNGPLLTGDGWTITLDRFVTALGDVDLDGVDDRDDGSCNGYSDTNYEWLFDFAVAPPSKVAVVYGLGTCRVEYRFRGPGENAVLGEGVTSQDAALMRVRATDDFATDERASLVVQGEAARGDEVKRFDWTFRRTYEIERCGEEGALTNVLELDGGASHELRIEVRAEELFRRVASDEGPFQFDLYASADADADGLVTLEELDQVDAPPDAATEVVEMNEGEFPPPETLADLLYDFLLPRVTRIKDGPACSSEDRDR